MKHTNKMKATKIVLALASLGLAQVSNAVDLTTDATVIYIGGASAQTPGLAVLMGKMCNAGTAGNLSTYLDGIDGKQAMVYTCDSAKNSMTGLTEGSKFVVAKVDAGGSWAGLDSVVNHKTMRFPNLTNAVKTVNKTNSTVTAGTLVGAVEWDDGSIAGSSGNAKGTMVKAQIALSDVSAKIFKARGQTVAATGYTTSAPFAGQGFGVIVSPSLYTALQTDQGIVATGTAACVEATGACQPSISREQYAAVVTGATGYLQALLPNTSITGNPTMRISRRSSSSGTQAASDLYFLNAPCGAGNLTTGAASAGNLSVKSLNFTDTGLGTVTTVVSESSTGNVRTNIGTAPGYAIGVVSLENPLAKLEGAKYVKINGVSPNYYNGAADTTQKINVVNGLYDFAYEFTLAYNNTEAPANSAARKFADEIVQELGRGANLTGSTGVYGDPASASKTAFGLTGNSAASPHTSNFSRGQNECKPRTYFY